MKKIPPQDELDALKASIARVNPDLGYVTVLALIEGCERAHELEQQRRVRPAVAWFAELMEATA